MTGPVRRRMKACAIDARIAASFAASGLTSEHLAVLGIEFVEPNGDRRVRVPVPAARITYFDLDGKPIAFCRLRSLESWTPEGETKERRYAQPANTGNRLYLPPLLDQSWREIAVDPAIDVIVTEGEKKAACGCSRGFPTIGLGGVWSWKGEKGPIKDLDLINWEGRTVFLAFDSPDVQNNRNVTDALERLAEELRGRGATVRFVHFPCQGDKVGLDDFLVSQGPQALSSLLEDATDQPQDVVSELNAELAMVPVGGKAMILRESPRPDGRPSFTLSKPHDIAPLFANRLVTVRSARSTKKVNAFTVWMTSTRRRKFDAVVFEPGGTSPRNYNMWRGFAVDPVAGDCSLFIDHVRDNVCNGDSVLFTYVMGWMAHSVQKPAELPGTALVLRGKQGVGKSLFCQTFGALFGDHFVQVTHQGQLLGNFNLHLQNAYCVCAEEAVWAGDKASEGVLKAMITEPTRLIEGKGKDPVSVSNYTRLLVSSNQDWVVPAGLEERRMVLIDVAANKMQDSEYFGRIAHETKSGGQAALLHLLLSRDLSTFDPRRIPKTTALLDTKMRTASAPVRVWFEILNAGCNNRSSGGWEREVSCDQLHAMYAEMAQHGSERRKALETELGRELRKLVPALTEVRRREGGGRQVRKWCFPPLQDCRRAFETRVGQSVDWPPVEVEDASPARKARKF